jgi:hypothetical protein
VGCGKKFKCGGVFGTELSCRIRLHAATRVVDFVGLLGKGARVDLFAKFVE